jgi:predicted GNAT family N-acyltransferase
MTGSETSKNGHRFRPYSQADQEAVIAIFRSNIPKYFTSGEEQGLVNFLSDDVRDYYVIEINGEVVGAGGIGLNEQEPLTVSLCWGMVRQDHLGTGLGKALTQMRINIARERFDGAPLSISTSQHTQGFYEKFGFELTRHEVDGFSPGIDICEMRLEPPATA